MSFFISPFFTFPLFHSHIPIPFFTLTAEHLLFLILPSSTTVIFDRIYNYLQLMNPAQKYLSRKSSSPFHSQSRLPPPPSARNRHERSRSKSPRHYNINKSYAQSNSSSRISSTPSINPSHLRDSLEDIELFPAHCVELVRHEQRNIIEFKRSISNEKRRVNLEMESFIVEINHILEDYRLSLQATLDRIYQNYITKYAEFKSEIMEINRLKDEIESQILSNDTTDLKGGMRGGSAATNASALSNERTLKSLEAGTSNMRKYHLMNYITQLQKDKSLPMLEHSEELVILSEYANGFYQPDQFKKITKNLVTMFRSEFHLLTVNVWGYMRDPEAIVAKERDYMFGGQKERQEGMGRNGSMRNLGDAGEKEENERRWEKQPFHERNLDEYSVNRQYSQPNLDAENPPPSYRQRKTPPLNFTPAFDNEYGHSQSQRQESFHWQHEHPHHQAIVSQTPYTGESIKIQQVSSFKSAVPDIILSCLWVEEKLVATGNKNGSVIFYDPMSKTRIVQTHSSSLKHKSSVCTLSTINNSQYLASGSDHPAPEILIWSLSSLEPLYSLSAHKSAVTAITCLRDSEHMISGSYDKRLCVYSYHERKMKYALPTNKTSVTALCLNADGSRMVSSGLEGNVVNIWQVVREGQHSVDQSGKSILNKVETLFLEQIIENNTMVCSLVPSPTNPSLIYIGTKDGKIKLVDIDKGSSIKNLSCCSSALIEILVIEQPGRLPIILGWPCKENCFKIVDCETGKVKNDRGFAGELEFSCGVGPKVTADPGGNRLVVGSQGVDREMYVYRVERSP